jgi:TonB-linked SusC/RagA family outer membrane protein
MKSSDAVKNRLCMMLLCIGLLLSCPILDLHAQNVSNVSQKHQISGIVKDSNGDPVLGASVSIVGSRGGTITDVDGKFVLSAQVGAKLSISYVGYDPQTVVAQGQPIVVILSDHSTMLKEVQVVAYGVQKKVTVTGAISSIKGDELLKTPTGSISNMLSGQLPGVSTVQYSGEPGADAASIYVRGIPTLNGASPLIQVDGVERDFNDIDPNEIENITVLKDASATAVFGVRGANGVILITTKRGSEGKAHVSVTTSASVNVASNKLKLADSYQYATYYNQMQTNDGVSGSGFSSEVLQKFKDHSDPIRFPDTNWMDYCFKNAALQSQHNINISGGVEGVRYFVSVGAFTQSGLFKQLSLPYDFNFNYKRFNYRANLDFDLTKTTVLSVNLGGRLDDKTTPYSGEDNNQLFRHLYWATPFSSPGIVNGKYVLTTTDYTDVENMPFVGASGLGAYYGLGFMAKNSNTLNVDLILNQKLDFVTKGLTFNIKGSYNSSYYLTKNRGASVANYNPVIQSDGSIEYRKNGNDSQLGYSESFGKDRNWYMETSIGYNRTFGGHHIGALLLYNQSKQYYPSTYSDIPHAYVGMVGRTLYDFKNKYIAEFDLGHNGSENFPPNKRYGWFPAGSIGWIPSEETFFDPLKSVISFLKFRISYGLVGNDQVGGDRFMYTPDSYVLGGDGYNFGTNTGSNKSGAYESAKHNPNVTWEKAFKQDYGVEANFLQDRLKTSFDYYYERRKDILIRSNVAPGFLGFSVPYANLGKVNSSGYEVSINWSDKIGHDFRYWIGANLSYNKNKIINEGEAPQNYQWMMSTGRRIGARSLYKFWGFYDETANERYNAQYHHDIATHPGGLLPGDCVYVDLNNDGVIDSNDQSKSLSHTDDPEYVAGLNMGFSWKNLDVTMQWTGAWNVDRMLDETFRQPLGDTQNKGLLLYQYENTWTPSNPSQNSKYPRATKSHATNNYAGSTLYLADASYLRLKSIQITYHFNFALMRSMKMNDLALSFSGYNIFTITGFKWGDPESRTSDRPSYPLTKTYSLSLKIGF